MIKVLIHILKVIAILALHLAVVPNFINISYLNVALIFVLFVTIANSFNVGLVYALIIGFVIDIYSFTTFGVHTLAMFITVISVYKIFIQFFTNKSIYALAGLTLISTVIFNFVLFSYKNIFFLFVAKDQYNLSRFSYLALDQLLWEIIFNMVVVVVLFFIFNLLSRKFNAVFIDTVKN